MFKYWTRLQFCEPIEINPILYISLFSFLTRILNRNHRVHFFSKLESYLAQVYKTLFSESVCCVLFVCSFVFWKWCLNVHYCVVNMPFNVHSPYISRILCGTVQDSTHRPKAEFSIPKCFVKFVTCLALKVGTAHFYNECEQMLPQSSCQVALFLLTVHVAQPVTNTFILGHFHALYRKPPRCVRNHHRLCVQSLEVVTG